jgi:hypothetical protein
LIGAALGDSYEDDGFRYTGRHWWGAANEQSGIEPILGEEADGLATELGLPGFGNGEFGTTIVIIGASVGESPHSCMHGLAEAAAWHCWPKMVDLGGGPDMHFDFRLGDEDVAAPDPNTHPELRHFVAALLDVMANREGRATSNSFTFDIRSERPKQLLGHIALRAYSMDGVSLDPDGARPFQPPSRHVALLRHPRLVVNYLDGPELPVPGFAWAGVFHAADEVDYAFARSEPPSHDGWVYQPLTKSVEKS